MTLTSITTSISSMPLLCPSRQSLNQKSVSVSSSSMNLTLTSSSVIADNISFAFIIISFYQCQ